MEFRQLRYFVAVARLGHFRRAAEELRVAEPALSQQIRNLERELQVKLLDRDSHALRLTEEGATFAKHAENVLAELDRARYEMEEFAHLRRGEVKLGGTVTMESLAISDLLYQFQAAFPSIAVSLLETTTGPIIEGLRSGHLDAGLLAWYQESRMEALHLACEGFYQEQLAALVPCGHRLAARDSIALTELASEPLIFPRPNSGIRASLEDIVIAAGVTANIAFSVGDPLVSERLVASGAGVALALRSTYDRVTAPVRVLGLQPAIDWTAGLVLPTGGASRPAVTAFIEFARRYYRGRAASAG